MAQSYSVERLVKLLRPDLSREEVVWMKRWAEGPLSTRSARRFPIDIVLSKYPHLDIQADMARLERRCDKTVDIVHLLYLVRDLGKSKNMHSDIECNPTPIVSINSLDGSLFPQKLNLTGSEIDGSQGVLFGNVVQNDLVQDLVYAMQGIDGKFFTFLEDEKFSVSQTLQLPHHVYTAVQSVGEIGVIYRSIVSRLSNERTGRLFTSFKVAVTQQLKSILSLAALVDGNVENWSLLKLLAWLTVPIRKLRFLDGIVEEVCSSSSSEILNILFKATKRRIFQSASSHIFDQVVSVWLEMVEMWVVKGQISSSEFFIQTAPLDVSRPQISEQSTLLTDSSYVWRSQFAIHADLLPEFLSHEVRDSIKLIGKGSAFIRICCTDHVEIPDVGERFRSLSSLKQDLDSLGDSGNLRVVDFLLNNYRLVDHLRSIKQSLLLSQGDFADSLMQLSSHALSKPAKEQNKYHLGSILETALRMCNLFDSETTTDVSNRLEVCLGSPVDITDSGFDVFELNYVVNPPLDVILNSDCMRTYRKCFSYIWNIIRCDIALSKAWKDLQVLARQAATLPAFYTLSAVSELIHKAILVRTDQAWFIRELRTMVCYDVIETEWRTLEFGASQTRNVEQLINIHEEFLLRVQQGLFLTPDDDDLLAETLSILGTIVRFTDSLPAIVSELSSCIHAKEDVNDFRLKNMKSLLEDLHDRSNDSLTGLFELVEDRRQQEERSEFFDRLSDRLIKRGNHVDRI